MGETIAGSAPALCLAGVASFCGLPPTTSPAPASQLPASSLASPHCSGAAIATTFTAATGQRAEVAISGESRIDQDTFGRATVGASGASTDGQVTAIAAQVRQCACLMSPQVGGPT